MLDLCTFAEASQNEQEIVKLECFIPESKLVIGRREPRSVVSESIEVEARVLAAGTHHGSTFTKHQKIREAILQGIPPAVSARDGLRAVEMGAAAEQSALVGRPIELG